MSSRRSTSLLLTVIAACTVAPLAAACSVEQTLPPPYCFEEGSGLIVAQSVPTAEIVPCIGELPEGWTVASTSVDQDRTVVRFDSDRAGEGAAVLRFDDTCDPGAAVPVPSDDTRVRRYEEVVQLEPALQASWYAVVQGGCWWWEFDFREGASTTLAVRVDDAIQWISREELNENIARTFVDAEV